jgi:homoserine dehydrogenase
VAAEVRLALTGFGNVGQGLAQLLEAHSEEYERRYGVRLLLSGVADRGGAAVASDGLDPGDLLHAKRVSGTVAAASGGEANLAGETFLDRSGADILVEGASTNFTDAEPGWSYAQSAVQREMDVVLASKGALVLHFDRLMAMAGRKRRRVLFSGTIGAPLPILELADRVLVGVRILALEGIVNATTNQILTVMADGASYEEGVRAAQQAGVAESDPTLDVDGWDAAAKAVILARSLFNASLRLDDVRREGIRGIGPADLAGARSRGETYKLVTRIWRDGSLVLAAVAPECRPLNDILGRLRGQEMGVVFKTDLLGDVTSTVQDTGGVPTALTVLRDVINLARERGWAR